MSFKKPKIFYGYWIVVAAFLCAFVFSGCGFFAFSLFVKSLQADFGWGRGEINLAFTIYYLIIGLSSPFVGRVVDRYGARRVIFIGALIAGLGFVMLTQMNNLWHFYVGYITIGVGMTATGHVPATAVVSNWFRKKRGLAIGIMSMGIGVGGFALAPLVGGYLIPSFGWRASYLALALITWVLIIPVALWVIKTRPADMGLYPDGIEASEAVAEASLPVSKGLTLNMALATSAFWLIVVTFLTSQIGQVGTIQSQVPYLEDIGFPMVMAAATLGAVGLGSAIGKFGFGWLCDKIPPKYACAIGLGLEAVSIFILVIVGPASPEALIWLYAIMMGLGAGSWLPTMSMLTSTSFGLSSYGAIYGMIALAQNIGVAIGPLMAGYMYVTMNTYYWVFIIFIALHAVAIPAVLAIRRPKSP